MSDYHAPLDDMRFLIHELVGLQTLAALPGLDAIDAEIVDAALSGAGRLAHDVLAPLNRIGDREAATLENGRVRTASGFRAAYAQFVAGGWNGVQFATDHGGQGLPWLVAVALNEMWQSANMGFSLCSTLTQAAVELLAVHGSAEQQARYLPKLVSGEWSGTMVLTEPQAGSDVGALKTRAVPEGDHYRITGQKIFISFGDHDFTDNIIHLVLARTPDAPAGTRGISLFIVPKFLLGPDGSPGARNDLRCVSLEHKMGIHASPTAVLSFGDDGGAIGYLVGEEHQGMRCMFTMMNNARLGVGLQGVAIAERAYQRARAHARERLQGRDTVTADGAVPIIRHPDVRRMLLSMKSQTEAIRALAYYTAALLDRAKREPDAVARSGAQDRLDLLTPVVKAFATDTGVEVASLGIQVHGGMGFIEETGAAQHYRDARIAPIYEGTNGIQALDLTMRKVARDGGDAVHALIAEIRHLADEEAHGSGDRAAIGRALAAGCDALAAATDWIVATAPEDPAGPAAGAVHYLRLFGTLTAGWLMARAARIAAGRCESGFATAKLVAARFYTEQILPQACALLPAITGGGGTVMALAEEQF